MEISVKYRVEGEEEKVAYTTAYIEKGEMSPELIDARNVVPDKKFTVPKESVIQHRTLTKDTAKKEVLELFEQKGELDYGDIIQTLGLDLEIIVDVCQELQEEGRIQEID